MYQDPKSKISQLEKVLYSRDEKVLTNPKRHGLENKEFDVNEDWKDEKDYLADEPEFTEPTRGGMSLSVKIFLGSLFFFIIAAIFVFLKFWMGTNVVSGDNINILVKAPVSVSGGEIVPFEIEILNNNNIDLNTVDLSVNFPSGSRKAEDLSSDLKRTQEFIGDIAIGKSAKRSMKVALFGSENEKKEIKIEVQYKVAGSNSFFNKSKSVPILISSSPVSLVVTGPTEVNTNQSVDLSVTINSNSQSIIKGLVLKAEYPFGFVFRNSNPDYTLKNDTWLIGDLEPGGKRVIKISGKMTGQESEERGFNFTTGLKSADNQSIISTPFATYYSPITIRRPFVSADIFFGENKQRDFIATAGGRVDSVISWQNNLTHSVSNVSVAVKLTGNALNKSTVTVEGGFYRSVDNTIIFNKTTDADLGDLGPGQTGQGEISFETFSADSVTGSALSNPQINMEVSVRGTRTDFGSGIEEVLSVTSKIVKITAEANLLAKALHFAGSFQNTGPIPPRVDQETTYTITWTVTNPLNALSDAKVTSKLSPNVKWLDKINPGKEKISFDSSTGQVTWSIGNIPAGAGTVLPAKEVSFMVSLLPSANQIGTIPIITDGASFSAKDIFANTDISDSSAQLDTNLTSDPYFKANDDKVLQ